MNNVNKVVKKLVDTVGGFGAQVVSCTFILHMH